MKSSNRIFQQSIPPSSSGITTTTGGSHWSKSWKPRTSDHSLTTIIHSTDPSLCTSFAHHIYWCINYTRCKRIPVLPTEICERIIDFVAEENPHEFDVTIWNKDVYATLLACTLTCRAWVPRTRRHLFRFLGAKTTPNDSRGLNALHDLLTQQVHLQQYVDALSLHSHGDATRSIHLLPLKTPRLLPRLQRLHYSYGEVDIPPGAGFDVHMRQFSHVTVLQLTNVSFSSVHDLRRTVSALRGLAVLSLHRPTWRKECNLSGPALYPSCRTRLKELWISAFYTQSTKDGNMFYFLQWLVRSSAAESLHRANLWNMTITHNDLSIAVYALLQKNTKTLVSVSLAWSPRMDPKIIESE